MPNQKQNSSKQQVSDSPWRRRGFQLTDTKTSPVLGNKDRIDSTTIAARANSPCFQSFANKNENLSKVCQTFGLLEQKVRQAFQTCKTCRFRNLVVNQTQIPSLPSLLFSELAPIKHNLNTLKSYTMKFADSEPGPQKQQETRPERRKNFPCIS